MKYKAHKLLGLFLALVMLAGLLARTFFRRLAIYAVWGSEPPPEQFALWSMLMATVFPILFSVFYCTKAEVRPLRTMGFTAKHFLPDYLCGAGLGVIAFGASLLLSWAAHSVQPTDS